MARLIAEGAYPGRGFELQVAEDPFAKLTVVTVTVDGRSQPLYFNGLGEPVPQGDRDKLVEMMGEMGISPDKLVPLTPPVDSAT